MIAGTVSPDLAQCSDLFDLLISQLALAPELHPSIFGLGDPVHLALTANVVLELGNESEDAHDELAGTGGGVDRGVIQNLELTPFSVSSETMR